MEPRAKETRPGPRAISSRAQRPRSGGSRLSVGFILARRFTLCAFANFVDVLRLAADEGDRSRPILCDWSVLSDTMDPVPSSCGVTVQPGERLGDPARFDYIVVVGGLLEEIPNISPAYTRFLQRAAEAGVPLVGLCTGAFVLHRAGLMQGYRACVSWYCHADFLEQFDGLEPISDQIFVVDGDRLTCAGGASSAHLAAYLVEKHVGRAQASKSLHIMIIDNAMRPEKPQPGIPLDLKTEDPMVRRALLLMQQRIDTPLSVTEIARQIGREQAPARAAFPLDTRHLAAGGVPQHPPVFRTASPRSYGKVDLDHRRRVRLLQLVAPQPDVPALLRPHAVRHAERHRPEAGGNGSNGRAASLVTAAGPKAAAWLRRRPGAGSRLSSRDPLDRILV